MERLNEIWRNLSSDVSSILTISLQHRKINYNTNIKKKSITYFHWKIISLAGIWTSDLPSSKPICYQAWISSTHDTTAVGIQIPTVLISNFQGSCRSRSQGLCDVENFACDSNSNNFSSRNAGQEQQTLSTISKRRVPQCSFLRRNSDQVTGCQVIAHFCLKFNPTRIQSLSDSWTMVFKW